MHLRLALMKETGTQFNIVNFFCRQRNWQQNFTSFFYLSTKRLPIFFSFLSVKKCILIGLLFNYMQKLLLYQRRISKIYHLFTKENAIHSYKNIMQTTLNTKVVSD